MSLFKSSKSRGGKNPYKQFVKKGGDLPQPSSGGVFRELGSPCRFCWVSRYLFPRSNFSFCFVRNVFAFKASETLPSLLLKSNAAHPTHPFLITAECGWQRGEGFSVGDLPNKELRLFPLVAPNHLVTGKQ